MRLKGIRNWDYAGPPRELKNYILGNASAVLPTAAAASCQLCPSSSQLRAGKEKSACVRNHLYMRDISRVCHAAGSQSHVRYANEHLLMANTSWRTETHCICAP